MRLKTDEEYPGVYNLRGFYPAGAVRVDRGTPWGNPYRIGRDGSRNTVCEKFLDYAIDRNRTEPDWLAPLVGKDLLCWCAPLACHAYILLRLANPPREETR